MVRFGIGSESVQGGEIENVYILMFAAYPIFDYISKYQCCPISAIQIEHKFCASFIISYDNEHKEIERID